MDQVELKDQYLNSSMSINKVKEDIVIQFNNLKMLQDMEQMKIDTIHSILNAYNEQLRFKYTFEDFERIITDEISVAELSNTVKRKVKYRLEEEQAELIKIEEEKQQAIKQAKLDAEKDAEQKRIKEEQKHQQELKMREREENKRIRRLEAEKEMLKQQAETRLKVLEEEKNSAIENIAESVNEFIPIMADIEDSILTFKFEISDTGERIETLKNYLSEYDYNWELLF